MPLLLGAAELARAGLLTSGDKTNREYIGEDIEIAESVSTEMAKLLYDPQTAGGLLIGIPAEWSAAFLARLNESYPQARVIGRVVKRGSHSIIVY